MSQPIQYRSHVGKDNKYSKTPEQKAKSLIEEKGINEAKYSVQSKLDECRNEKEQIYWTNVLNFMGNK